MPPLTPPNKPTRNIHPFIMVLGIFATLFILSVSAATYSFFNHEVTNIAGVFAKTPTTEPLSFGSIISSFVHDAPIKGESEGRTNFMIYGLTLDENRTDTIMLASYYWKEHKLVTLNIPRDLSIRYHGLETKLVSLYAYAKHAKPNDKTYPPDYVSKFISDEYGIPIDYWLVVNMNGFRQIVDNIGGITVDVDRPFTDYKYPTDNYSGYIRPAPHFESGSQAMNGSKALIFARSRHSPDLDEGSDFARSKRQEKVIRATLEKIRSEGLFYDISKITEFSDILGTNLFTSLSPEESVRMAKIAKNIDFAHDFHGLNWGYESGFFCDGKSADGAYALYYGTINDCNTEADTKNNSIFRKMAREYIQNLLDQTAISSIATTKSGSGQMTERIPKYR